MMGHRNRFVNCNWRVTSNKEDIKGLTRHGMQFLVRANIKGTGSRVFLYPLLKKNAILRGGREWQLAWDWRVWRPGKAATWGRSTSNCRCAGSNDIGLSHICVAC